MQAVHDPFEENNHRMLTEDFLPPAMYRLIKDKVHVSMGAQIGEQTILLALWLCD